MSQGQRVDQEKAVSRGASDSAVAAPALLGSSWTAQCPPGLPGHQAWGSEGVAKPRLGVRMEERGRAKRAVWKGWELQLLCSCSPPASQQLALLTKICCLGVACVWPDPLSGAAGTSRHYSFFLGQLPAICWLTGALEGPFKGSLFSPPPSCWPWLVIESCSLGLQNTGLWLPRNAWLCPSICCLPENLLPPSGLSSLGSEAPSHAPHALSFFFGSSCLPAPVFLPGKLHGRRNLVGYSPWGRKESNTTEHTHKEEHQSHNFIRCKNRGYQAFRFHKHPQNILIWTLITFSILPSEDNNDHLLLPQVYERGGIVGSTSS